MAKSKVAVTDVKGICKDTNGFSPVPVAKDGTHWAMVDGFDENPNAMMVLWKDHMAGKVDFFLKIHVESLEDYHEFVRTKLSKIDNIGVLESYFVLKEITDSTEFYF